jgi:hypothetical protein
MTALPWWSLVRAAGLGTLFTALMAYATCPSETAWFDFLTPGRDGPAVEVVRADFPDAHFYAGEGHDGQLFYAIAREPWRFREVSEQLDRPRYRYQRPLLSWLAWALHPTGGGPGLVIALFAVGVLGLFVGGVAVGALSVTLRGPPWLGALFPLMGGSWWALRISGSDGLAAALSFLAIALALRRRGGWAIVVGVGAVLAKESFLLVLIGYALWRRRRDVVPLVAVPAAVGVAWWVVVRATVPAPNRQVAEFGWPLQGLLESAGGWARGEEPIAAFFVVVGIALGVLALVKRGLGHPMGWIVALQFAFLTVLVPIVLFGRANGPRAVLPLTVAAVVALATPNWRAAHVMAEPVDESRARPVPSA